MKGGFSIGIGGSYLGARAAIEFLRHSFYNTVSKEIRKTPEIYFVSFSSKGASKAALRPACAPSINLLISAPLTAIIPRKRRPNHRPSFYGTVYTGRCKGDVWDGSQYREGEGGEAAPAYIIRNNKCLIAFLCGKILQGSLCLVRRRIDPLRVISTIQHHICYGWRTVLQYHLFKWKTDR